MMINFRVHSTFSALHLLKTQLYDVVMNSKKLNIYILSTLVYSNQFDI